MSNLRLFLLLGLFMTGFLIWQQWQIDYAPQPTPVDASTASGEDPGAKEDPVDLPSAAEIDSAAATPGASDTPEVEQPPAVTEPAIEESRTVRVLTDVLDLEISTEGGSIVSARLLDYAVSVKTPDEKVQLMGTGGPLFFVAQAGLISNTHPAPDHRQRFEAEAEEYVLGNREELVVPLHWVEDGIRFTREYRFRRGAYDIEVTETLQNETDAAWQGIAYRQLQRTPPTIDDGKSIFTNPERFSFTGPAFYTHEEKYEKFDFDDVGPQGEQQTGKATWVAMVQHYFFAAWIPPAEQEVTLTTARIKNSNRYLVRAISPAITVQPQGAEQLQTTLYVGPKLQEQLDDVAEGLALTVDYGVFTPFSKVLYWLLHKIYLLVGNWGWAIVGLTLLVKAAFFKLTEAQYRSMAKLRKLQPRIQALKERYGDDKQQFNLKMMEIYKQEKVNPLGGCLPVLIQIPVFIALYWVLIESVEMRQAPFILWINDLSSPDPYFILPLINGAAMFMTTKLSPNPAADPIQQKIMLSMPIVFSVMFAFFQAGLVLYWAVNATLSLAQQWVITKRIDAEG
ncbi:MAG: membrane protein insertase YidC [Xanthomonadales bacterium]|nr:membrane protein insertase YidC [Xanthomonadales bacterium]